MILVLEIGQESNQAFFLETTNFLRALSLKTEGTDWALSHRALALQRGEV
jgi:hypothetical protein